MSTYTIRNFRVFGDESVSFNIRPITVLTGCNSSGKSSMNKSMLLLSDMFRKINADYVNRNRCYLEDYRILLTDEAYNLGRFDSVINHQAKKREFTIEYDGESYFTFDTIRVRLTIVPDDANVIGNGRVKTLQVYDEKGTLLMDADLISGSAQFHLLPLKQKYMEFARLATMYNYWEDVRQRLELDKINMTRTVTQEECDLSNEYAKELDIHLARFELIRKGDFSRDHLGQLLGNCDFEQHHLSLGTLFYLPILDLLCSTSKEALPEALQEHFSHMKIQFAPNERDREYALEKVNERIRRFYMVIEDYLQSDFTSFADYYAHYEDIFLASVPGSCSSRDSSQKESFIDAINESLAFNHQGFYSILGIMKDPAAIYKNEVEEWWNEGPNKFLFIYKQLRRQSFHKAERMGNDKVNIWYQTPEFDNFVLYFSSVIKDLIVDAPSFVVRNEYMDANRANVQRLYTYRSQGSAMNRLLQEYVRISSHAKKQKVIEAERYVPYIAEEQTLTCVGNMEDGAPIFERLPVFSITKHHFESVRDFRNRYKVGTFMKKWLRRFGIADDMRLIHAESGAGLCVVLVRDGAEQNLADFGFGVTQLVAILMRIEVNISKYQKETGETEDKNGNHVVTYDHTESYLSIEEPESHLHPNYQSLLAEMFADADKAYNVHFILETHSEYLIRKLQVMAAKNDINPEAVAIHYLNDPKICKKEGIEQVVKIDIKENGQLTDKFGPGFFDEAGSQQLEIIRIARSSSHV